MLIVLDVNLPGMDGVEACRQLRTFSDAYVVMLTGLDSEADRLIGLAVGADDYMSNLRRKLGAADYVRTVRGFGYRMGEG